MQNQKHEVTNTVQRLLHASEGYLKGLTFSFFSSPLSHSPFILLIFSSGYIDLLPAEVAGSHRKCREENFTV